MNSRLTAPRALLIVSGVAAVAAAGALIVTGSFSELDADPLIEGADHLLVLMQQTPADGEALDVSDAMCDGEVRNVSAITGWERLSVTVDDAGATVMYAVTYPSTEGAVRVRVRDDVLRGGCVTQFAQTAGGR